jgi:exopolysaccharide production protein ExoY
MLEGAQTSQVIAASDRGTPLLVAHLPSTRRRVFVIGAAEDVEGTVRVVANGNGHHSADAGGGNGGPPVVSELLDGELCERLRRECPDEVHFLLGGGMDDERVVALGSRLLMDGVDVHFVLPGFAGLPLHAAVFRRGPRLSLSLSALREHWLGRALRRLLDIAGSLTLLMLLLPVLALVAGLVWWKLGGPIVFAQQRVGRGGKLFRLYKFRSMVPNAEEVLRASPEVYRRYVASNYKLPEDCDPRVTRLGRVLRKTSLDEMPQLWNVLRGEMSLVGPRPIVPEEIAEYGDYGRLLTRVKPGLTGLWQVSGRSRIGYPERARIDLRYVGERSLGHDLQILLRTVPVVLSRRGAL